MQLGPLDPCRPSQRHVMPAEAACVQRTYRSGGCRHQAALHRGLVAQILCLNIYTMRHRSLAEADQRGVAAAVQHHGKEMSYNNYLDADAAYGAVCDYAGAPLLLDPFLAMWAVCAIVRARHALTASKMEMVQRRTATRTGWHRCMSRVPEPCSADSCGSSCALLPTVQRRRAWW